MAAATFYHQPGPIHHQSFPGYLPSPPSSSSSSSSRNLDFRPRLTMDPATGSGDSASGGWWGNEGHWQAGWSSRQSGRDSAAQQFDPPRSSSSGQGERHQQPDFNSGGASSYQSGDPYHSHRYDHAAEASYPGRRVSPSSTVAPPVSSYPPSLDPTHTPTSPRRPLEPAAEIVPSPPSGKNHQRSEPVSQLAEFAASMICYLWFARTIPKPACSKADQASPSRTDLNPLQFQPTQKFLRFCHDVLTTSESRKPLTLRRRSQTDWVLYVHSSSLAFGRDNGPSFRLPSEVAQHHRWIERIGVSSRCMRLDAGEQGAG